MALLKYPNDFLFVGSIAYSELRYRGNVFICDVFSTCTLHKKGRLQTFVSSCSLVCLSGTSSLRHFNSPSIPLMYIAMKKLNSSVHVFRHIEPYEDDSKAVFGFVPAHALCYFAINTINISLVFTVCWCDNTYNFIPWDRSSPIRNASVQVLLRKRKTAARPSLVAVLIKALDESTDIFKRGDQGRSWRIDDGVPTRIGSSEKWGGGSVLW